MTNQLSILTSIRKAPTPVGAPHGKGRNPPRPTKHDLLGEADDDLIEEENDFN